MVGSSAPRMEVFVFVNGNIHIDCQKKKKLSTLIYNFYILLSKVMSSVSCG